ncbi:DUF4127 family protein [Paenibacillus lemnae]|uniref:DUF4127 family protein n=1 Tax=Paenibacillus lemnae TaxID=1330551 RepID=A0A848M5H2_PAELE|nr:DUF4127 family protein [Paenibacillus lemnae]NMO95053.1 DUF4127 family protein [Paenibacillus lemnae]
MKKVLYVPLDDRPVNLDDVIILGRSAGLEVITPDDEYIKNRMDSHKTSEGDTLMSTSCPHVGDTAAIRRFIEELADSADGFIISSDMLAYGGLIGSRRLRPSGSGNYPDYDPEVTHLLDVIRTVKERYPHKPVYVLDTIMRLATTTYVDGVFQDAYDESRNLMKQPRKPFSRLEDILSGYDLKPDGTPYPDSHTFNKEEYYEARRHKFKSNVYLLHQLCRLGFIDFLAIGVDDSSTQGVQANEIIFIENYINENLEGEDGQQPERVIILPDADGLGHSLMARMACQLSSSFHKRHYAVQYFGPDGCSIINPYEYMSVHDNIRYHVEIVRGQLVDDVDSGASSSFASKKPEVQIIAVTGPEGISAAIQQLQNNAADEVPSVVIDFTGGGAARPEVAEALLDTPAAGQLLGYSAWNTAGNKIGIALGMAQARYAFVTSEQEDSSRKSAVQSHGSLLFKRFLKDYAYKKITIAVIREYSRARALYTNIPYADGHMLLFNTEEDYVHLTQMLQEQMQLHCAALAARNAFGIGSTNPSRNVLSMCGGRWTYAEYTSVSLPEDGVEFTWHRAFEITLQPSVVLNEVHQS